MGPTESLMGPTGPQKITNGTDRITNGTDRAHKTLVLTGFQQNPFQY